MKFIDFCAGIGGFRLGLELAGLKCIGFCEKDKFAIKSYKAMFNTEGEWFANDITKLKASEIPYAEVWCFGFPCQDISIAGNRTGLCGERSSLYYNIINLIKGKKEKDKPKLLLIENVKNLLSINRGFDFAEVLYNLDQIGYDATWKVLNSKDFGVPQNRERVFIIANLRNKCGRKILPIARKNTTIIKQIIGGSQGCRVYNSDGISRTLTGNAGGMGAKTGLYMVGFNRKNGVIKKIKQAHTVIASYFKGIDRNQASNAVLEVIPILTPDRIEKRQNGRRMKNYNEPMFTLTGQDRHGVCIKDRNEFRIRRLTPKECFRLQGFPDELFEKAKKVNSDSQLYKQAGNAVTVNVAYAIGQSIS